MVILGAQAAAPTTPQAIVEFRVPAPGEHVAAYPVRVVNDPDPWYQRNAVFLITATLGVISWVAKAKVLDPLRAEFLTSGETLRVAVKEEALARAVERVETTAAFAEALAGVKGTVQGLNTGVAALGPAITSISTAMERNAIALERIAALDRRVAMLENLSHGFREARRRETPDG